MGRQDLLIGACVADIHFAAMDPKVQYEMLHEQFIKTIMEYPQLDYIAVAGDLYDHKLMGNSDGLLYASLFIDEVREVAKLKNSTVLLIAGTFSHDAGQLKNFYHYLNNPEVDFRVIETIQFVDVKGYRLLCIPELYGLDESIYQQYLTYSGYYDVAIMHGTFKGAVYGDNAGNGRLFDIHDFRMCRGYILGGHVHIPGCFDKYFTYCGSYGRWKFGEEQDKGFLTTILDGITYRHYIHFNKIDCASYVTIDFNDLISNDPKTIIEYINRLQLERKIDYLKIKFKVPIEGANKVIIDNYYRNNAYTFVEFLDVIEEKRIQDRENGIVSEEYDFILDPKLSDFDKFVKYVNMKEGSEFITVDKLRELLEEAL